MKYLFIFLSVILLSINVNSFSMEYRVFDYNTRQAVELVNITIYGNNTDKYTSITDIKGLGLITLNYSYNYTLTTNRAGYDDFSVVRNYTNISDIEDIYLNPSTTEGIMRLRFSDLTLQSHDFCLYFTDNNRLQGCYQLNDTVTIHNNINYTFIPMINKGDIISNPETILKYLPFITPLFLGIMLILIIFLTMIIILISVYYFLRRKK